jgi:hypothetical protein
MPIACPFSSRKMVDLKGGGQVGNGASGANRLLNIFYLSECDNTWYLDSNSSSSKVSYTTWSRIWIIRAMDYLVISHTIL